MIQFSVNIEPRGKGRPRATARGGFARLYTDEKTRKYEAQIAGAAILAMQGQRPLQGPLMAILRFRLSVPPSFSRKRRAAILSGLEPYFGSWDLDNAQKSIFDACNSIVFTDDKQIMRLTAMKVPSDIAGIDVRIESL